MQAYILLGVYYILFGDYLAATLNGGSIILTPLNINDPSQTWTINGGYIASASTVHLFITCFHFFIIFIIFICNINSFIL